MQTARLSILIVDDEAGIRFGFNRYLSHLGYRVKNVSSLKAAYDEIAREKYFDVLILDVQLPDGNGLELLKYVKEKYPEIVVFVVTGNNIEDHFASDRLFHKPVSLKELQLALAEVPNR